MHRILLAALLLLVAAPAWAQPAKLPPYPERVSGWRLDRVTDYESRPGGAGNGSSANYQQPDGGSGVATVYVFDRGRRDLVDGPATPEAASELNGAITAVALLAPHRGYRIAARRTAAPVPGPDGRPALSCEALILAIETGGSQASIACVGVVDRRFVKLRLSRPADAPGDAEAITRDFGRGILAALRAPAPAK